MFSGTNKVCVQCVNDCKQFAQVYLEYCPKRKDRQTKKTVPFIASGIASVPATKEKSSFHTPRPSKQNLQIKRSPTPKGLCPICKENKAESKHHIKPKTQGGLDTRKNIVNVCDRCHDILEEYADDGLYYCPELARKVRFQLA